MKKLSPLVSIIVTTYNRYELLRLALKKIYEQTYPYIEVIVSDDCSTDKTYNIKDEFPSIKYVRTPKQSGYMLNAKYALSHAKGDYILFSTDDDLLGDNDFLESTIKKFNEDKNIDMVFSRVQIGYGKENIINKFPFKTLYSAESFFDNFLKLRLNFDDYYVLSTIVFKKDKLNSIKPFKSIFNQSSTIDSSIIFRYVATCNSIAFLDMIGHKWNRPKDESLSNSNREDLVKQARYNLAFPFDVDSFVDSLDYIDIKLRKKIKAIMSQRVEYSFHAILSEKERLNNQSNFRNLLKQLDLNSNIYIYGRGWTGLELKEFFLEKSILNYTFVDDYKLNFEDTICFKELELMKDFKQVVITSYKYKDIYKIYRRLNKLNNIKVYDLLGNEE